ncbi:MAG: hypothetical protein QOJ99_123, partial [Bryobacterales bacterium]|nr:hypothetical protein [Bryobacterales bacterium]
ILEARFDQKSYNPNHLEFQTGRGLSIKRKLGPNEVMDVFIHAQERWPDRASALYTSYYPATDLKVMLRNQVANVDFDFEILYFWDVYPVQEKETWEVFLDRGLLPYQGVKLNWKRKESGNGNQ